MMHPQDERQRKSSHDRPTRPFPSLTPRTQERLELPSTDSSEDLDSRPPKKRGKRYHCPYDYENLEPSDVDEEAAVVVRKLNVSDEVFN